MCAHFACNTTLCDCEYFTGYAFEALQCVKMLHCRTVIFYGCFALNTAYIPTVVCMYKSTLCVSKFKRTFICMFFFFTNFKNVSKFFFFLLNIANVHKQHVKFFKQIIRRKTIFILKKF